VSALTTLVRQEARECRQSLIAAPCISLAVLATVHVLLPLEFAVAQAAASCVGILVALWTVYFAADLFATDCASGCMRAKALLPVSALEIWRAKVVFYALAVVGIGGWALGCEYALQWAFGSPDSRMYFTDALEPFVARLPFLAVVAASAILCSLIVDSALVALLCSALVAFVLAGIGVAWSRGLSLLGVVWGPVEWSVANVAGAALLLALGALAFARGQARFGSRRVRLRLVLSTLGAALLVGGIVGASAVYRRVTGSLEDPRSTFETASASPDGRWLAIEVVGPSWTDGSGRSGTRSVWVVDLATHESELVVWPGCLRRDWLNGCALPWDDAASFRAEVLSFEDMRYTGSNVRVALRDGAWASTPCDPGETDESRIAPAWAETTREKRENDGMYALSVRWPARGIEREFVGDRQETGLGRGIFLSPVPGRVLTLRDDTLAWVDLEDEQAVSLATDVYTLQPSPGGSAILVRQPNGVQALSALDGRPLREPWPADCVVSWIEGEGDPHAVLVRELGRGGRGFVEDLDNGARFEFEGDSWMSRMHRLSDGRYVYVDQHSDIVIADARGARLEKLVDR